MNYTCDDNQTVFFFIKKPAEMWSILGDCLRETEYGRETLLSFCTIQ